jgi:exosortase
VETPSIQAAEVWKPRAADILAMIVVVVALGYSYRQSFASLIDRWERDPNYSFGFLVVPIALAIAWSRRDRFDRAKMRPRWWGFLPLLCLLAVRIPLFTWNEQYVESAEIPFVVAALTFALGGWHLLYVLWPAILFLIFMLPLPPSLNSILAYPLQRMATLGSVSVLQILGLPAFAEGNVITIGAEPLEVAQACNGLSMLLSFVTLISAMVILVPLSLWRRVVLLASAIPIALVTNIIRIVVTAWCYHRFGHESGERMTHDAIGLAMPVFALGLAFLELQLMSWLVREEREVVVPGRLAARPQVHRSR